MAQHWYNADGQLVDPFTKGAYPSVTTIQDVAAKDSLDDTIARLGEEQFTELMEKARDRGTRVHEACERRLNYGPERTYEDDIAPFMQGFENWLREFIPTCYYSELFLRSTKYKFAGTADIICEIDGVLWLIDIKTTSMHKKEHGIQLKAYQQAYYEMFGVRPKMAVLKLTDKTKKGWQWKVYDEPFKPFLGLLNYFNWTVKKRKPVIDVDQWSPDDIKEREVANV